MSILTKIAVLCIFNSQNIQNWYFSQKKSKYNQVIEVNTTEKNNDFKAIF